MLRVDNMKTFLKFLLLVVMLNAVRYLVGGPIESLFVLDGMFGVMQKFPDAFNSDFSNTDMAVSFFYNFMLWLSAAALFFVAFPALKGHYVIRSLKIHALMCLFFLSLTAIYMNHFVVSVRSFFLYSMLDAVILFLIVGTANGLIFPLLFKKEVADRKA